MRTPNLDSVAARPVSPDVSVAPEPHAGKEQAHLAASMAGLISRAVARAQLTLTGRTGRQGLCLSPLPPP